MFKRLALTLVIFSIMPLALQAVQESEPDMSFMDDYAIGVKAYDDGFFDVAKKGLEKYLENETRSEKAGLSYYLLYQLYMRQNNYKAAQGYLANAYKFKDKRFDMEQMSKDQMYIETRLDCEGAKNLLVNNPSSNFLYVYSTSKCPIDKKVTDLLSKVDFSSDSLHAILNRVKDDKELVYATYSKLPEKRKTKELILFFGNYFRTNGMDNEFEELYKRYPREEFYLVKLDDIWKSKNMAKYINFFDSDMKKEYKIPQAPYCRYIEASNSLARNFDCNLIDKCLDTKSIDWTKNKLACYMKRENKADIEAFINSANESHIKSFCEYGKYIVGKNLYSKSFLTKFSDCADRLDMYRSLLKVRDYEAILLLAGKGKTEVDYGFIAVSNYFLKNMDKYNEYLAKVTDPDMKNIIKQALDKGGA